MVLAMAVGAACLGFAVATVIGIRTSDPGVQGAIVGAVAGLGGGIGGACIGALSTWAVARAGHDEARRENTRRVAAEIVRLATEHFNELTQEMYWRRDQRQAPWPLRRKPAVGSSDRLNEAGRELMVTAREDATYEAGVALVVATITLDRLAVQGDFLGRTEGNQVRPMTDEEFTEFEKASDAYHAAVGRFMFEVRKELGSA